jgi:lathosterol oxidase
MLPPELPTDDLLTEFLSNGALWIVRSWIRYLIVCGGAFLLFWVILAERLKHRRCQPTLPDRAILIAELKNSMLGIVFFVAPIFLSIPLYFSGHLKVDLDPTATTPAAALLTFVLFTIGADTWFYWTHRAMHDSRIYRWTHELHHLSEQPSPLAGYSFSLIEGVTLGLYLPVFLLIFPVNVVPLAAFVVLFTVMEAYVHLGFEVLPHGFARGRIGKWLGTAVFHDMHHQHRTYNFAVYFTWWDRLMGTIHPDYADRFDAVTARPLLGRPGPDAT